MGRPREEQYTVGIEEEAMLLEPDGWQLAHHSDRVLEVLPPEVLAHATMETHRAALELATGVHESVGSAAAEMLELRRALDRAVRTIGLRAASSGTHPSAVWQDTVVSDGKRYAFVYGSMRELARREPTFALHVHVGISGPNDAVRLVNRMRAHVPLLLALSVNSPFWQGRDTGLASARTPLFQAFPRVGIPRRFRDYEDYVGTVDLLMRCGSMPDPTFLWWDVRPQPRFGTVEVRIMDTQTTVDATAALVALVQSLAKLECEEEFASDELLASPEVLAENRFLAARDGAKASLVDPVSERRVPVKEMLTDVLAAARPHARDLGCEAELMQVYALAERPAAARQLWFARRSKRLPGLVEELAAAFVT
jgi:carboxylate-amine ligase